MIDQLAIDPATFTRPAVWLIAAGIVGASGLGYKAYRLGHDTLGPIVAGLVR